ncbi:MAG TPA: hypothetical protein VIK69_09115 [Methylophilaceae bacterium]
MKVDFTYTNGRRRMVDRRCALVLQKLGRGYLTRDMRAEPAADHSTQSLRAIEREEPSVDDEQPRQKRKYTRRVKAEE